MVIRLIDPPLHEFLDDPRELAVEIARKEALGQDVSDARKRLRLIDGMMESNPMLGLRGVRLSIVYADLPLMQVRAAASAAARLKLEGFDPRPEIMIPLVSITEEHVQTSAVAERVIMDVEAEYGVKLDIPIGTMIELPRACLVADEIAAHADFFCFGTELPRACLVADEIAAHADFFCFGTNDLTQTTFGFSRDDAEAKFLPANLHEKVLASNPFETVDPAVLQLVKMAVDKGRAVTPEMHPPICMRRCWLQIPSRPSIPPSFSW